MVILIDTVNYPGNWFADPTLVPGQTILGFKVGRFLQLSTQEKFAFLERKLSRLNRKNKVSVSLLPQTLEIKEANRQAILTYTPPIFPGRVTLIRAGGKSAPDQLQPVVTDAQLGWSTVVTGELKIQELPCNHFNIFTNPRNVKRLAECLKTSLSSVQTVDSQISHANRRYVELATASHH